MDIPECKSATSDFLELRGHLPAFILGLLLLLFLYVLLSAEEKGPVSPPSGEKCKEGGQKSCSIGPCNGTQTCINGSFSKCTWKKVCTPDSYAPCEGACAQGYRVCNVCGSGYGPCIESGKEG